ncbi:MAG: ATP-binding protein [Vampirovibrionales bacterium]|nr:ATP-binding protein [Vampirovibrionales bacterium]
MLSTDITALFDQLDMPVAVFSATDKILVYNNKAFQALLPKDARRPLVLEADPTQPASASLRYTNENNAKTATIARPFSKIQSLGLGGENVLLCFTLNPKDTASPELNNTLSQAHRDFISTVSHEFRTPLTSIKGFADTLLKYGTQLESDKQQRFINIIRDQADRLIRLVEALLEVSKNGSARLDVAFRPVPLKPLLERVTQSIAIKSPSPHPVIIDVPEQLAPIWADADKLEQVLTNLVENAFKYSDANTTVTLRAFETPASIKEDSITIEIEDEGMGIPQTHLEKLFTQFYRIEGPLTQKVEGTGLGLYIVKSLLSAMGGHIGVESTVGKGSVFRLTLPLATLERQATYHRKRCMEDAEPSYAEEAPYGQ